MGIKEKVKERYGRLALDSSGGCCVPGDCSCGTPAQAAKAAGYSVKELRSVPEESILGAGCGAPVKLADLKEGKVVVDLGSGAGIDVFLAAKKVGRTGRVIGVDMTDEMLQRARKNAAEGGYSNVEFRKGDIEERIPLDDGTADVVVSNCVINLTTDKVRAFREIRRVLKSGGRMVISDLVTDREATSIDPDRWCSCIDGAMTEENYLASMRKAGFANVAVLEERPYIQEGDGRMISSIAVRAVK